jgi:hypothetical protein
MWLDLIAIDRAVKVRLGLERIKGRPQLKEIICSQSIYWDDRKCECRQEKVDRNDLWTSNHIYFPPEQRVMIGQDDARGFTRWVRMRISQKFKEHQSPYGTAYLLGCFPSVKTLGQVYPIPSGRAWQQIKLPTEGRSVGAP